jgi:hypothetical protein
VSLDGVPQAAIVNAVDTVKAKDDKRIVATAWARIIIQPLCSSSPDEVWWPSSGAFAPSFGEGLPGAE